MKEEWTELMSSNLLLKSEMSLSNKPKPGWHNWAIATIAAFTTVVVVTSSRACAISDFEIKQADWRVPRKAFHMVTIVGEIKSNCATAMGAEVQAVFRDSAGKVITTREFYPKKSRDLQPGEAFAFTDGFLTDGLDQAFATMSVKVIGTYRWSKER